MFLGLDMSQSPTNYHESTAVQCLDGFNAMRNPGVRADEELENGAGRSEPSYCSPHESR